jgi:hypothetical protein
MAVPMLIQADESATNIEKIKQLRQVQNQSTVLKNLKANSVATKGTAEQERMLRLSNALTKVKQQALPDMESTPRLNLKRTDRPLPQASTSALRDVFYGSGTMSGHADSLFFNFLSGENSGDSLGMDVRITGNEGLNFGNEFAYYGDPSMLYWLAEDSTLDGVSYVDAIDDPLSVWTDISWNFDNGAGNGGGSLQVGNLWVVYARTSQMYVVLEVTETFADWTMPRFSFDYMIQADGSNIFDGTPSLFDMTVNDDYTDTLEIGSNPYFEITLDNYMYGEFAVIWDSNHDGLLDDGDIPMEFYDFMDNDMNDDDPAAGIFGFTYTDEMADGLNYLADDLLFVATSEMDMAVTSVHFYTLPSPFSVSGAIYETNGGGPPLEGIVVWAVYENSGDDEQPAVVVVTDAAGQYHLDLPDTGNVMIGSEDHFYMTEGLLPDPSHHFVNVQSAEFGYNFYYVAPTSTIEGYVYDETGAPIEGVEVKADGDDGPGAIGITSPTGYYSIGVMPGDYDVGIEWETLPGAYVVPHSEYVFVGDFAVTTVNFTLHTANNFIVGVVTLDGLPIEGVNVVAMNELGFSMTMSQGSGFFDIPVFGGPETFYDLMVWMPDDMSGIVQTSMNHQVPAGAEGQMITLETISGGLFGYFIDAETSDPIMDGFEIGMMMRDIDTDMMFHSGPNYDGYYEIHVPPGLYEVTAGGPEWMGPQPDTILIADILIEHDLYVNHMSFDASLDGYVFNEDGIPIPYAQVQIGNDGWGAGTMADEFGYYYFDLPVGYYYVSAWAEGHYMSYDEFPVGPGPNAYNFFLEHFEVDGAIAGEVYDADTGAPLMDANVYAYAWDDDEGYWSNTDEFGEFWFDLPNGTYDIVVEHWDYPPMWIDEISVQNDTTYLDFAMVLPAGGVDGYVYDDMGFPVWDAEVVIVSTSDPETGFWGYTDNDGYFSIPAMNGDYDVYSGADGFEDAYYGTININDAWVNIDIYLAQLDAAPPEFNFIVDQPNDQGRQVRMAFWPGSTEWGPFSSYSIWRWTNTPQGIMYDFVDYIPNYDLDEYMLVAPTLVDSSANLDVPEFYTSIFVVAGHWDAFGFIEGQPMTGYSKDNIHPGIPGPLSLLSSTDTGVEIGWEMSMADDFQYFEVYRATNPDFTDADVYATVETMFSDGDVIIGQTYYYAVSAVDANGNMSETTNVVTTSIVSVDDLEMIPTAYGLSQNYPNPFNPTTSIEFALPEAAQVSLEIYNLLGQKVRTLVNGYVPAGYINTSWDGLDQNGKEISSGTYIYRLQTADQTFSKKMVLMK